MPKIMLTQSIKAYHNVHGPVLTGRVSLRSHGQLLTIDVQILMPQ